MYNPNYNKKDTEKKDLFIGLLAILSVFVVAYLVIDYSLNSNQSRQIEYVVTFDINGGEDKIETQVVLEGNCVIIPNDPKREGFTFNGWYLNESLYDFNTVVTEDFTLVAKWIEKPFTTYYTIKFDANDGKTKVSNQKVVSGGRINKPDDPKREGFTFSGWYLNGSLYDFNTVVTKDFTLVAKWSEKPSTTYYTIKFDANDGKTKVSSQKVVSGGRINKPDDPKREGFTFNGWYLNGSLYDFNTVVTEDFTLVAKWSEKPSTTYYTIKFDVNGGKNKVSSQKVEAGEKLSRPNDPKRDGFVFKGWYLNGQPYDFNTKVTKEFELVAFWEEESPTGEVTSPETVEKYTIKFITSGGSAVSDQTVKRGERLKEPSDSTRSGYTFLGWYTENKNKYEFDSVVEKSFTLRALWAPVLNYKMNDSGKWIFVNNPELLGSDDYLADSDYGNHLLYRTSFSGNAELYYEHGVANDYVNKIYYAIRIYNPNTTPTEIKINKCGASMGWDASAAWKKYYNGTCNIAGKTYIIQPKESIIIYHNGSEFLYGNKEDVSSVAKVSKTAFDGVLNMTSSNLVYIANLTFKDINKTYTATYDGNYTENLGNTTTARVYSGEYNKLPILTQNMVYEIYDETPTGKLPVSYIGNDGGLYITGEKYNWETNLLGGKIDVANGYKPVFLNYQHVSDFIKLSVPNSTGTITLGPYNKYFETRNLKHAVSGTSMYGWSHNWGNWAVHYKENITIKNNSSNTKTVTLNLVGVANQTIMVYYNGQVTGYTSGDNQIWTVTIPPGSTKKISTTFLLGGMSNGRITKELILK